MDVIRPVILSDFVRSFLLVMACTAFIDALQFLNFARITTNNCIDSFLEFCFVSLLSCRAENFNTTAVELLRRLPGVSDANYRSLMAGCKSIAEMALLSVDELAELMGGKQPARMLRDFLDAKCPTLV